MANILVCEDDELYQQIAQLALSSTEHQITMLDSGQAVLDRMASSTFDLLITDIVMPDKDGLEVIKELRDRGYDLPILVMTGGASSLTVPILAAAEALGANEVIAKPFRPQALRTRAEELIQRTARQRLEKSA